MRRSCATGLLVPLRRRSPASSAAPRSRWAEEWSRGARSRARSGPAHCPLRRDRRRRTPLRVLFDDCDRLTRSILGAVPGSDVLPTVEDVPVRPAMRPRHRMILSLSIAPPRPGLSATMAFWAMRLPGRGVSLRSSSATPIGLHVGCRRRAADRLRPLLKHQNPGNIVVAATVLGPAGYFLKQLHPTLSSGADRYMCCRWMEAGTRPKVDRSIRTSINTSLSSRTEHNHLSVWIGSDPTTGPTAQLIRTPHQIEEPM